MSDKYTELLTIAHELGASLINMLDDGDETDKKQATEALAKFNAFKERK